MTPRVQIGLYFVTILACSALLILVSVDAADSVAGLNTPRKSTDSDDIGNALFFGACEHVSCLQRASFMLSAMNQSADPCEDPYSYACSGLERVFPGERHWERLVAKTAHEFNRGVLRSQLKIDHDTNGTAAQKAGRFFSSCKVAIDRRLDFTADMIDLVESYDGFVNDLASFPQHWDRWSVLHLLMSDHGIEPFFTLLQTGTKTLEVQYPYLPKAVMLKTEQGHPTRLYRVLRDSILKTIQLMMSNDNFPAALSVDSKNIDIIFNDVLFVYYRMKRLVFEDRFAHDYTSSRINFKPSSEATGEGLQLSHINMMEVTLSQLHEGSPKLRWNKLLTKMYGQDLSGQNITIRVPSLAFIRQMEHRVQNLPPQKVQNFLIWNLVLKYLPVIGPQYANLKENFLGVQEARFIGFHKKNSDQTCTDLLLTSMNTASLNLFISRHIAPDNLPQVNIWLSRISSYLNENMMAEKYGVYRQVLADLGVSLDVSFLDKFVLDAEAVDRHYAGVEIARYKLLSNIVALDKLRAKRRFAELVGRVRVINSIDSIQLRAEQKVLLTLPYSLWRSPTFSTVSPSSIIASGFAISVIEQLLSAPIAHFGWEHYEGVRTQNNLLRANLVRLYRLYGDSEIEAKYDYGENDFSRWKVEIIVRETAISMAMDLFDGVSKNGGTAPQLPGLRHMSETKLFFVNLIQNICLNAKKMSFLAFQTNINKFCTASPRFNDEFMCPRTNKSH